MLKAILIDCIPPSVTPKEADYRLSEAESLVKTYGGVVLVKKIQKKLIPNYATYIGGGKIEEIVELNTTLGANIVIINNELKPRQIYNLSEKLKKNGLEVWDRVDLILKIFQKHATTREAKLEIQLASIKHMGPRIFGMGMELSRQGGGIGTKGVGETNTEFMKRHLARMEHRILEQLEECKKVRKVHRDARKRKNLPTVGIIGYTNVGKTSLLNALTRKGAYAAHKLFATLDTRVGKIYFPENAKEALVSDTIGFIQDLPTTLIKSFQSTLEETIEADLLLHVMDVSDPRMTEKIKIVNVILAQIDALYKPTLYVLNKIDCLPKKERTALLKKMAGEFKRHESFWVSSVSGEGLMELKKGMQKSLGLL